MIHILRFTGILACVFAASPLLAAAPTFKDRARLFSPQGVDEAKNIVDDIRAEYHKDVTVETYSAVPFYKDPWGKVKKMSPEAQDRFVRDWAKDRLSGSDAIAVLIVHGSALKNVQVVAGRSLLKHHGFTADNCRAVRERLQTELNADRADAGLTSALQLVHVLLHENLGEGGGAEPFDWLTFLAVIVFVAGVVGAVLYLRKPRTRQAGNGSLAAVSQLLRSPDKPAVPHGGFEKPAHEPLKDWW